MYRPTGRAGEPHNFLRFRFLFFFISGFGS